MPKQGSHFTLIHDYQIHNIQVVTQTYILSYNSYLVLASTFSDSVAFGSEAKAIDGSLMGFSKSKYEHIAACRFLKSCSYNTSQRNKYPTNNTNCSCQEKMKLWNDSTGCPRVFEAAAPVHLCLLFPYS